MKEKPKLYTLDEAYQEILRIKKDMGLLEYQKKIEKEAEQRGYAKACNEIQAKMNKEINILGRINCF